MTVFTEVRTGRGVLENIKAPYTDVLGAAAEDVLSHSPTSSLARILELRKANDPYEPSLAESEMGSPLSQVPAPELMSATDARSRLKTEGLESDLKVPDSGIRSEALDILVNRKHEEKRRRDILNRAPSGFLPSAGVFGAGLVASIFDPLNVASAFIPIVGPARYAGMLERAASTAARVGVRARVGAIEGAAGAALVEPIVLGAAVQEQSEYGLSDTLLNIAFGTVLGGGLHVGVGAASDAIARRQAWQQARANEPLPQLLESVPQETRETALRTGVAQAVTGRQVDVESIVAYHGSPHEFSAFDLGRIGTGEGAQSYGHGLYFSESAAVARDYQRRLSAQTENEAAAIQLAENLGRKWSELSGAEKVDLVEKVDQNANLSQEIGGTAERKGIGGNIYETRILADRDQFLDWDKPMKDQPEILAKFRTAISPDIVDVFDKNVAHGITGSNAYHNYVGGGRGDEKASRALREVGIPGIKYLDQGSRDAGKGTSNFVVFDDKLVQITSRNDVPVEQTQQAARASFNPENMRLVDIEAVRAADERIRSAPANDDAAKSLASVIENVQALARSLGDEEIVARELKPFDELTDTADVYGKAVRAAADCGLRRGS